MFLGNGKRYASLAISKLMKAIPRKSRNAGFTLLEMLIVLALLVMLMVGLTGMIFLGITARARVTAVTLDQEDFVGFRRVILLALGREYPDWVTNGQYKSIGFEGAADHVAFLGPALATQGYGLARYWIKMDHLNGRPTITLRTQLDNRSWAPILSTHFATGLASLKYQYFGLPRDGGAPMWQNEWTMRSTPPDLVSIQIIFPKGDRRSWPAILIHPEIDADITCEIDADTHQCVGR